MKPGDETLPKFPNDLEDDYKIECDRGFIEYYSKDTFVTLEDWRQQQLDKLL